MGILSSEDESLTAARQLETRGTLPLILCLSVDYEGVTTKIGLANPAARHAKRAAEDGTLREDGKLAALNILVALLTKKLF
jgi:hypothetical protein